MQEQIAQTIGALKGLYLGSQVTCLRGTCYRAVRESVMSARRGTRDVSSHININMSVI